MADHNVTVEVYYGGAWQSVPAYARDGVSLARGARSEGQDSPPSSASLTLDNRTGAYSPKNPTSPLYGLVGRNTPLRVSADGSVRSVTEVASWKPEQALRGDAWTSVEGGGILRRIQQGETPLKSSFERALLATPPVAFWPMYDDSTASQFLSGLPGGQPVVFRSSIASGVVDGPTTAVGAFPNFADTPLDPSYAEVNFTTGFSGRNWMLDCIVYIAPTTDGQSSTDNAMMSWSVTGSANNWRLNTGVDDNDGPYVSVFGDVYGQNADVGRFLDIPFGWSHVQLVVFDELGDGYVQLHVNGTSVDGYGVGSKFFPGTNVGAPSGFLRIGTTSSQMFANASTGVNTVETASLGLVSFSDFVFDNDHYDAFTGYVGETAGDRFLRILGEEGIAAQVIGDEDDTQLMGAQPTDTLINIVRECIRTDAALLFEPRTDRALVMRTGRNLYNQAASLTLSYIGGQISPNLSPVLDDQGTRNDVTAARTGGSSARAVRQTGPLNVNDPLTDPQGVGRVDTQISVNPANDETLADLAGWYLHKGTVDEARYPQVTVDLDAAPSLTTAVNSLEIGDKIVITNLPMSWTPDSAVLIVIGISEKFPSGAGDYRRLVTFTTVPASTFEIGVVGADDGSTDQRGQAIDTDSSILQAGITSAATSFSVTSSGGVAWTNDSDDWSLVQSGTGVYGAGLFIVVGGEVMRVTNIASPASPQTFTVVRSVNGVIKAHSSGAAVHVFQPVRVGL